MHKEVIKDIVSSYKKALVSFKDLELGGIFDGLYFEELSEKLDQFIFDKMMLEKTDYFKKNLFVFEVAKAMLITKIMVDSKVLEKYPSIHNVNEGSNYNLIMKPVIYLNLDGFFYRTRCRFNHITKEISEDFSVLVESYIDRANKFLNIEYK